MTSDVIASWVEGQESCHTSNFFRLSEALQWDAFSDLGLRNDEVEDDQVRKTFDGKTIGRLYNIANQTYQVFFAENSGHVTSNESRTHNVDSDSAGSKFLGV